VAVVSKIRSSCCEKFFPLQGSTVSVRNLKVSLLARDTPAHVQHVLPARVRV
jgi:hypothetical protein